MNKTPEELNAYKEKRLEIAQVLFQSFIDKTEKSMRSLSLPEEELRKIAAAETIKTANELMVANEQLGI